MLCSIGDDQRALLWNINSQGPDVNMPFMQYESETPLLNVAWCNTQNEWIGIIKKDTFNMLKAE